jgi:hypothetical protein
VVGGYEQRFFPTRGPLEALKPGAASGVVRLARRQQARAGPPLASSSYPIRFESARPAPDIGPITGATEVFMLTTGKLHQ